MKQVLLVATFLGVCWSPTRAEAESLQGSRPNIVLIMPDGTKGDSMINLDDNVGKMMNFLDKSGLSENTLLIYMTDNGASSGSKMLRGGKGSPYEGGTRVPCIMYWKGKIEGGIDCNELTGHIDFYPTFAELAGSDVPVPGNKMPQ